MDALIGIPEPLMLHFAERAKGLLKEIGKNSKKFHIPYQVEMSQNGIGGKIFS
jgi:hypothetical protein